MKKGFLAAIAALVLAAALAPAQSSAADWQPCLYAMLEIDCANFDMPMDRTGAVPGTTTVRAIRMAATEGPRMGTLFVIAGGPGQTSQVMLGLMSLFEGANRYDVIAVDQRGSGMSEPLDCPRIESGKFKWDGADPKTDKPFTDCSTALGPQRSSYNTAEAIADLDAVRADLGVDNATFFGVSYGTKVALAYAKAYPAHTKALLLDSVLPTDMPGAFDTDSIAASRGALREICAAGRCRGIGAATVPNLAKLAARLQSHPIPTFLVSPTGKIEETKIDAVALYDILFSADLNLFIYNQIPGMLTEALRGNTAQLERLFAIVNGATGSSDSARGARRIARFAPGAAKAPVNPKPGDRVKGRDAYELALFSNTMFFATTCADLNPPWTRGYDITNRQSAIDAAAAAIPDSEFYPFSRRTAKSNSAAAYCRGWHQSPTPPAVPQGPLPDIPALVLDGTLDLRTPVSWAERAIVGDPHAQLVRIPNNGHSVVGTDISGCALSLAKRFLIYGGTDGKCKETAPAVPIAPRPATSLDGVKLLPGRCRGLRGSRCARARKQIAGGYLALRDTLDQLLIGGSDSGPGLYGGFWEVEYDLDDELNVIPFSLRFSGISNAPQSWASGNLDLMMLPSIDDSMRVGGYRVDISGRIAYDRAGDSLTLNARRGRTRVKVKIVPSSRSAIANGPTRSRLALRRNYALAGSPPPWTLPR